MSESAINQKVADQICNTGQWNGRRIHRGEFVALIDGQVVAVATNLDDALQALRTVDPDPRRGMVCEAGPPILDVIR